MCLYLAICPFVQLTQCQYIGNQQYQSQMIEQKSSLSYQLGGHCLGGPIQQFNSSLPLPFVISFIRDQVQIHVLIHFLEVLKNQLPNMPHLQLHRIVFSNKSQSFVMIGSDSFVGGICFQQINDLKMAKIHLMAISQVFQRQGHGKRLMNHFKSYIAKRGVNILSTYADNKAIKFYQKQGFARRQYVPSQYIRQEKQFTNSTLMQVRINQECQHSLFIQYSQNQRKAFATTLKSELLAEQSFSQVRIPNKPKYTHYTQNQKSSILDYFSINPANIMQITKNWSRKEYNQMRNTAQVIKYREQTYYLDILSKISAKELIKIDDHLINLGFIKYKDPIDLHTIRKNVEMNKYSDKVELLEDLIKLVENSRKLYRSNNKILQNLESIQGFIRKIILEI